MSHFTSKMFLLVSVHKLSHWSRCWQSYSLFRRHRWKAISPIAIDVTVPWFVCLFVCLSVCHVRVQCRRYRHDFFCIYDNTMSLPDRVKINVTYQASLPTPTSPGLLHHHWASWQNSSTSQVLPDPPRCLTLEWRYCSRLLLGWLHTTQTSAVA